ncbi:MAG: hypothetical protein A3D92_24935 [Bacteroidetes bacterium RIFCSPHIGHO2_02_FULL_44_7]|nr:MAG: hypothetical protein A3D92_24935 [Bacteroidetes bacterium RIFCSPHIGHO2_02_FULL_44_7]
MAEKFYWEKGAKDLRIDIPGFDKDEIKVELSKNSITISASKKSHVKESGKDFYREEASASSFSKSMMLPKEIDPKGYEVEIKDGVVVLKKRKKKLEQLN